MFWQATWAHRRLTLFAIMQPIAMVIISTIVPFFASHALSASIKHDGSFWPYLGWLALSVVIALIMNRIGFLAFMRLLATVMYELHLKVFACLLDRGLRFHNNTVGGKLVSDATDYPGAYNQLMNAVFTSGGPLAVTLLVGLAIIFSQSPALGAYILIVVLITVTWAYRESLTRSSLRAVRLKATKDVVSHLSDSIVNAVTVKTFAAEQRELHRGDALGRTLRDLRSHDWQQAGASGNSRMGFLLFALIGLLIIVYKLTGTNSDALGTGIFAFSYTTTLIMRLFDINNLTRQVEEAFLQASPMTHILLEQAEVRDEPYAKKLQVTQGTIELRDVSFAYTDSKNGDKVFSKLNLTIHSGEHIGLVGPSGGGKTTLTRLLLRFDDVQDGAILVDGQDLRDVTQTSVRSAIGYVPQEPLLFHRSIHENIAYGKPTASDTSIKRAAKLAYADGFIEKLPEDYKTVVGERGVKLSGGQRQRVAIARTILKNAPILVLDEATSALDSESEALIQDAMFTLMKGKTAIVIAHRLSTIQRLDRIIVIDEGRVVEEGTHAELLKKKDGLYARLWHHQSGGFLQED
jgi:ATP-binding cassette subfamily B protein